MRKRKMPKRAQDMLFWSMMIEFAVILGAYFITSLMPPATVIGAQSMLETLIRLDGVLFGFSAVMIGLFVGKFERVSKRFLNRCFMFALLSFWSYIFSIFSAFINIYTGMQGNIPIFMPVLLTLFGALCSSIYTVLVFIEEQELKRRSNKTQ